MHHLFEGIYNNRRVLVTGHTGFKGSWLSLWLHNMGAQVCGYSLEAPTQPSHWKLLDLPITSVLGDIRNRSLLEGCLQEFKPEIVFHLAAQPLVRESYEKPLETYETNVLGSLHVYDACRNTPSVKAVVSITTDKVYENREWPWGYRENDALGGFDPYSASKACADIATTSWVSSFWPIEDYGSKHHVLMATARAGNVVGGGDWGKDRLIPDLVRGATQQKEALIRNPHSTRPWEHVLEPLSGYLLLGQKLLQGETQVARPWNFGPASEGVLTVEEVVRFMNAVWPALRYKIDPPKESPHEANLLTLDCSLARSQLQWRPVWDGKPCFEETAHWYREWIDSQKITSIEQLTKYVKQAESLNLAWASKV